MRLHHVGVVVRSLEQALPHYERALRMTRTTGIVHDPAQDANLIMLAGPDGGPGLELIEPASESSPVARQAKKAGGPAHTCYEVDDLEGEIARLRGEGALLVQAPTPAVLFGGRRVSFLFLRTRHLIELVETAAPIKSASTSH